MLVARLDRPRHDLREGVAASLVNVTILDVQDPVGDQLEGWKFSHEKIERYWST